MEEGSVIAVKGRNLLLAELAKRPVVESTKTINLLDTCFPEQISFIQDASRMKAALCTRRSGKSDGDARMLIQTCLDNPKAKTVFIGLTRESAREILWSMLQDLVQKYGIAARFNETRLSVTFKNKSTIRLLGMDASESEQKKALGTKLKLVVIDEAQGFAIDLEKLIHSTLLPATSDQQGQIVLTGTPGDLLTGYFYKLTGQVGDPNTPGVTEVEGWSIHRWSANQNPHMAKQWAADIAMLKAKKPGIEQTPSFLQNYLGHWAVDEGVVVYKYLAGRNDYAELPRGLKWNWVLGVDLGFNDATAFCLCAYSDQEKVLYVVEVRKERGLDFTAVSDVIREYQAAYDLDTIVIDGANKQGVEEMRKRQGLPLTAAEKSDKYSFQRLMNDDFVTSKIKLGPKAAPLKKEYPALIWDARKLPVKHVEHPACENHAADAALYAWRHCYTYLAEPKSDTPSHPYGSPEWAREEAKKLEQRLIEEARQSASNADYQNMGWSVRPPDSY